MFKDTVNTETINGVKIPKLKGEITVQLFDEKTGKLEKEVHGENMITDAVKDIFKSNYFGLLDYNGIMPIAQELFGGVLCFRDNMTESAKHYYPPTTYNNPVVAHAGKTTYGDAGDDNKRGLPSSESAYLEKGYRHVWEFPSTQGNGTFSCICLTHKDTGDWWLLGKKYSPFYMNGYRSGVAPTLDGGYAKVYPMAFHPVARVGHGFRATGNNEMTIYQFKKFGAIEKIGLNEQGLGSPELDNNFVTEAHVISNLSFNPKNARILYDPSLRAYGASAYDATQSYVENDIIRFNNAAYRCVENTPVPAGTIDPTKWELIMGVAFLIYTSGTTMKVVEINLGDYSKTERVFTISGINMAEFPESQSPYMYMTDIDDDNHLYIQSSTNTICYKITMGWKNIGGTDTPFAPDNVAEITKSSGTFDVIYGYGHYGIGIGTNSTIRIGSTDYSKETIFEGNTSHDCISLADINNETWQNRWRTFSRPENNRSPVLYGTASIRWDNKSEMPRLMLNKLFLSTIYNLNEPISKSATQAMRITYQITEAQEV